MVGLGQCVACDIDILCMVARYYVLFIETLLLVIAGAISVDCWAEQQSLSCWDPVMNYAE